MTTVITADYPLRWPEGWERTYSRRSAQAFQVTFDAALKDLRGDLAGLHIKMAVLSSYLPLSRRGEVLGGSSRTRMPEPGVAIYFTRGEREYVLARDAYDAPLGNLRSIGLALQALRKLEYHGGAALAERAFGGFAALPPPPAPKRPWREVLNATLLGMMDAPLQLSIVEATYKAMAKHAHPDAGGKPGEMEDLNDAVEAARAELRPDGAAQR